MGSDTNVGKEVYHITKLFRKKKSDHGNKFLKQHQKIPEQKHRLTKTPKIPR